MTVIFDTFRNTEVAHAHKDIAVVVNDGRSSATDKLEQELDGCSAQYRYHEGRDDFSVANVSYAKVRPTRVRARRRASRLTRSAVRRRLRTRTAR